MNKFWNVLATFSVIIAIAVAGTIAYGAAAVSMKPTISNGATSYSSSFKTVTPRSIDIALNATACTTPGGASCSVILPATDVSSWPNVTIYVRNSGANTINDVLIEVSPDGTYFEEVAASTLDSLTTGTIKSVNYLGNYAYIRVEARAAAATSAQVWVTALRP